MGIKNRLKYQVLDKVARTSGVGSFIKRALFGLVVVGVVFLVIGIALISYTFNRLDSIINVKPDLELVALERLIVDKTIILSQQQKDLLAPFVNKITNSSSIPDSKLKKEVWQVLNPNQIKEIEAWKAKTEKQAEGMAEAGKSDLAEIVSKYSGTSIETVKYGLNTISQWWQTNKPAPDGLIKALQEN